MSFNFGRGPQCWSCDEHAKGGTWDDVGGGTVGYFCSARCLANYRKNNPYEGDRSKVITDSDCAQEERDRRS